LTMSLCIDERGKRRERKKFAQNASNLSLVKTVGGGEGKEESLSIVVSWRPHACGRGREERRVG